MVEVPNVVVSGNYPHGLFLTAWQFNAQLGNPPVAFAPNTRASRLPSEGGVRTVRTQPEAGPCEKCLGFRDLFVVSKRSINSKNLCGEST